MAYILMRVAHKIKEHYINISSLLYYNSELLSFKLNLFVAASITVRLVHIMRNESFLPRHTAYTMDSSRKLKGLSYHSTHRLDNTPLSWHRKFPVSLNSLSHLTAVPYSASLIAPITASACRCWAFSRQSIAKTQLSIWNPDAPYYHKTLS
jgi:hypothetical protein